MDKPEYIPIPRTGTKCPYCGLSRSGIYNLIRPTKANGYKVTVKSSKARLPGNVGGRRMVHYASLMEHLGAQVVPVELINLRRRWSEFRAQSRRSHKKSPSLAINIQEVDDLPDDAVLPAQ